MKNPVGLFIFFLAANCFAQQKCIVSTSNPIPNSQVTMGQILIKDLKDVSTLDGKLIYSLPEKCHQVTVSSDLKFVYNACTNELIEVSSNTKTKPNLRTHPLFINKNGDLYSAALVVKNRGTSLPENLPPKTIATYCGVFSYSTEGEYVRLKYHDGDTEIDLPIDSLKNAAATNFHNAIRCSPDKKRLGFTNLSVKNGSKIEAEFSIFDLSSKKKLATVNSEGGSIPNLLINNDGRFQVVNGKTLTKYSAAGKMEGEATLDNPYVGVCAYDTLCESTARGMSVSKIGGKICDTDIEITKSEVDCNCKKDFLEDLKQASDHMNCSLDGTHEAWKKLEAPKSLTVDQAKIFLRKFQKPGGYNSTKDAAALLSISKHASQEEALRSELANTFAAMELNGSDMPSKISKIYPALLDKLAVAPKVNFCLSDNERDSVNKAALKKVERYKTSVGNTRGLGDSLKIMSPILRELPENTKEELIEAIGDSLAELFAQYTGGSASTGYYLATNSIKPSFGQKGAELVDVQQIRTMKRTGLLYVANKPFKKDGVDANETVPGIYSIYTNVDVLGKKSGDVAHEASSKIEIGENVYQAHTNISVLPGKGTDFVNKSPSIDYKSLWKDKKVSGMVFLGANYLSEPKKNDELISYYLKYYKDQDFTFNEPKKVDSSSKYILDKIAKGDLDYMVKEAHAQGDVHSLGSVSKTGMVYEGVKKYPDGRTERINILVPLKDEHVANSLQKTDLAEAIKSRTKLKGDKPFIYINNSCSGTMNTPGEVETVGNKSFVNIASESIATTFWHNRSSTLYNVIDGVRTGKNYSEIRKNMEETPRYKNGENQYLFPDDPKYEKAVTNLISTPTRFDLKLQKNGNDYSFTREAAH